MQNQPLTHAAVYDATASAGATLRWSTRDVLPIITLGSIHNGDTAAWTPKRDLLKSDPQDTDFVVEIESDGTAFLRFGDDQHATVPGRVRLVLVTHPTVVEQWSAYDFQVLFEADDLRPATKAICGILDILVPRWEGGRALTLID